MNTFRTEAIILHRTNYGEADRILTLLTPSEGKLSAIAKGVRRPKSKLAGGLELFAVCDITLRRGKGALSVVTSARLTTFYNHILRDYDHLSLGYDIIKRINKATQTVAEPEFYQLLKESLAYLNAPTIDKRLVEAWFRLHLATLLGRGLNVARTTNGDLLKEDERYNYSFSDDGFFAHPSGTFGVGHIKLLRLLHTKNPAILQQVSGLDAVLPDCLWLAQSLE